MLRDNIWPCQNMTSTPATHRMKKATLHHILCRFNTCCTVSSSLKWLRLHTQIFLLWQQRWWHMYKKLHNLHHTLVCSLTENTQLWHMPLSHLNMHDKKNYILLHYTNIFQVHQSELVTNLVESFKPKDALPLSPTLAYDCCITPPKGRHTELSKLSWCSPLLIRPSKMNK